MNATNQSVNIPYPYRQEGKSRAQESESSLIESIPVIGKNTSGNLLLAATFLLMSVAVYLVYLLQPQFESLRLERMSTPWGIALIGIGITLLTLKVCFLLYVLVLFLKYKPVKAVSDQMLPTLTVIVPAYNEGELVWKTLMSLAKSDYPQEKIQLLAIDDGSKDNTWSWMQKAKAELGDRVTILKQPKNQGKRHALYRGFNLGTGEVFVTVDSDSLVKEDTLRQMVSPFVGNKECERSSRQCARIQ